MKIVYAAKHGKGCNDNEGAIAHALTVLGHDVKCIEERRLTRQWQRLKDRWPCDLLLFQNWKDPPDLSQQSCRKVFWYMDRIDYGDDPILADWTRDRQAWMAQVTPHVDLGVCTDGDWVARDTTGKLFHLMQGADERVARRAPGPGWDIPLLFTGTDYGRGEGRASWLRELRERYGMDFRHKRGLYGPELIDAIHHTAIVLAPDGPISPLYTSNRAVICCSFGGFLLHPRCAVMEAMYEDGKEAVFYDSRQDMHEKIAYYLDRPGERWAIQQAGFRRTMDEHLYRHKLAIILNELERRRATL